jgi:Rrf2 family transcriptional regulator, iron-sulfur cluster assembly transcription factor
MQLTRAAEYAIRCVLYMAKQPDGLVVSRREVATAMDIPLAFLGKIAQGLAKAGIMVVRQGVNGGYVLALSPKDISLLMVVEAMEGEIVMNECIVRPQDCGRSSFCAVHTVWDQARTAFRKTLGETDFARLAAAEACPGHPSAPDGGMAGIPARSTSTGQA